jgi:hypothetical protein
MRSSPSALLRRGAVILTAPALAFGLLTAAWKHSATILILTAGWCAFIWAAFVLLRAVVERRKAAE